MVLTGVDPHCDLQLTIHVLAKFHGFLAEAGNPTAHASQCRSLAASRLVDQGFHRGVKPPQARKGCKGRGFKPPR